jgi:DNA-binding response OmpR family regulator
MGTENLHPPSTVKKILLVEDDDNLANVYLTRLQVEGFEARRAKDGEAALMLAIQFKPHLILLDVMMPNLSGFDVLDILKNTPETANAKVVMLTARGQDSDQARAMALGADDYLVKSQVVLNDVIDHIKQHLELSSD